MGRHSRNHFNSELVITNVQQSDEGDYRCRAANTNGNQDYVIQVDVQGLDNSFHIYGSFSLHANVFQWKHMHVRQNAGIKIVLISKCFRTHN